MTPFPVIIGPTAGGKSDLAVELATWQGRPAPGSAGASRSDSTAAEILTADSIQIYRGLNIGSAKPTPAEQRGIPHHLIDIADPTDRFTVHDWLRAAEATIADIRSRGRVPIVVGGTHLYIKAFLEGIFDGPGEDESLRAELRARPLAELRTELERVDPQAAHRIHANDDRRTIRALEVFRLTGKPISEHQQQWDREDHQRKDCIVIGLDWPAELLNPRINARVKQMFERGLVEEARELFDAGKFGPQAREALGYKQLIAHFEGRGTLDEAIEQIKIETRRFAKNQRTWLHRLRTFPRAVWIDAASTPRERWVLEVVDGWRSISGAK